MPEITDNSQAKYHYERKDFENARDLCIHVADHMFAPRHCRILCYHLLAMMSNSPESAKRWLDDALAMCDRLEALTEEDQRCIAMVRNHTVRISCSENLCIHC